MSEQQSTQGFRLLVCGGRDWRGRAAIVRALTSIKAKHGISLLIQGGASGVDRLASEWAHGQGIEVATFDADWQAHGRAAGPIRNRRMIEEGRPDAVVAFPGGRGTADMVRQAETAGLKVWRPCA